MFSNPIWALNPSLPLRRCTGSSDGSHPSQKRCGRGPEVSTELPQQVQSSRTVTRETILGYTSTLLYVSKLRLTQLNETPYLSLSLFLSFFMAAFRLCLSPPHFRRRPRQCLGMKARSRWFSDPAVNTSVLWKEFPMGLEFREIQGFAVQSPLNLIRNPQHVTNWA